MYAVCTKARQTTRQQPGRWGCWVIPSAGCGGQSITHCITSIFFYFQNGANSGFEVCFCYRIRAPLVPGVPTKTRLESSIMKFDPHFIYSPEVGVTVSKQDFAQASPLVKHLLRYCCMPHGELCVWAGYDQLQANYPALTPWPKGSHL